MAFPVRLQLYSSIGHQNANGVSSSVRLLLMSRKSHFSLLFSDGFLRSSESSRGKWKEESGGQKIRQKLKGFKIKKHISTFDKTLRIIITPIS